MHEIVLETAPMTRNEVNSAPSKASDRRGAHNDRRDILLTRNRIKKAISTYFEDQGFTEVDPPNVQVSPGNEIHLQAFKTTLIGSDKNRHDVYLRTSPEFACKKLLAAGEARVFTFAPSFRNCEQGPLHHHEFTMLEWYRTGASFEDVMVDCENILRIASDVTGTQSFDWRGRRCDPRSAIDKRSVVDAFKRHANIDLTDTFDESNTYVNKLQRAAQEIGVTCASDDTWSDIFSRILTSHIEPNLGIGSPTILHSYPMPEAAWADSNDDPKFADRFELYCCCIELANGARELTDAAEQRERFEEAMDEKERIYGERYPIDEELMAAFVHIPPSSGVALGFDRLVMLATGAQRITDVMWGPLTLAE